MCVCVCWRQHVEVHGAQHVTSTHSSLRASVCLMLVVELEQKLLYQRSYQPSLRLAESILEILSWMSLFGHQQTWFSSRVSDMHVSWSPQLNPPIQRRLAARQKTLPPPPPFILAGRRMLTPWPRMAGKMRGPTGNQSLPPPP